MKKHHTRCSINEMCHVLGVSNSGYYYWSKRKKSSQALVKKELEDKICFLFTKKHGQMAGSPTITEDLYDYPKFKTVHRSRVASIMKEKGLCCKIQRKFTVTTDSNHNESISPNLLNRNFSPQIPHKIFVGDITYIRVASHWVYLSVFIDLYSRKIVGWDLSKSLSAVSTCNALNKLLKSIGYKKEIMVHSDRGVQYASKQFRNILKSIKAVQSMSRKGNCWDNAVAESFFHTLKTRLIYHRKYQTMEELERDLFWYIEIYYNRVRKHSANKWMTPEQKEYNFYQYKKVA